MPVYEYQCKACGRRFSRFFWRMADAEGTTCRCGSGNLEQLVSRVSMVRSEESRLESMADPDKWGD
ncbi:MAG: zinc ribbon domain-containing protein, partial [Acidobacteria bacterium]